MPYIQGEEFTLTDGIDTDQFKVESTDITKPYSVKRSKFLNDREYDCDCNAFFTITSTSDFSAINISSYAYSYGANITIGIQTNSGYNMLEFRDNNGESFVTWWQEQNIEFLNSYDNGYKIFNDVLKIETDTLLSEEQIYQLYIAKKVGIIQFKDRSTHKTWSLIE